ncbi:hypothetical protein Trydic_g3836 [Trypoxylus dichotomus]
MPLSGPILQQKAILTSRQFPETDQFTASSGWFDRWKEQYGVRQLMVASDDSEEEAAIEELTTAFQGTRNIDDGDGMRRTTYKRVWLINSISLTNMRGNIVELEPKAALADLLLLNQWSNMKQRPIDSYFAIL